MDIKLLGLEGLSTKEMKTCNGGREYWSYVGSNVFFDDLIATDGKFSRLWKMQTL